METSTVSPKNAAEIERQAASFFREQAASFRRRRDEELRRVALKFDELAASHEARAREYERMPPDESTVTIQR